MRTLRLLLTTVVGLLAACGGGDTGKVSLLLKDASGDFKAAVVTITEIDLVGSGGTTVLSKTKVTTDLLTLANDTAKLVDGASVPAGTYGQLRFVITGGYVEVEQPGGGSTIYASSPTYEGLPEGAQVGGVLRMPSYGQSGFKVDLPGGLKVGTDSHVLLVDFDVQQSFGPEAGASGAYLMHPVVQATEVELTGSVKVTLAPGAGVTLPEGVTLGQFQAVLANAAGSQTPVALAADPAHPGTFEATFVYLIPGDYTVSLAAPAGVTAFTTTPSVASPVPVTVASGQSVEQDFVLASVTP